MKTTNALITSCILLCLFARCADKDDTLGTLDTTPYIEKLAVTHTNAEDSTTLNAILNAAVSFTDVQITQNGAKENKVFAFDPKPTVARGDWFKLETLNVKESNGYADAIKIVTQPNNTGKERSLVITLTTLGRKNTLHVTQQAN